MASSDWRREFFFLLIFFISSFLPLFSTLFSGTAARKKSNNKTDPEQGPGLRPQRRAPVQSRSPRRGKSRRRLLARRFNAPDDAARRRRARDAVRVEVCFGVR